jgi:predicted acetyltransferase
VARAIAVACNPDMSDAGLTARTLTTDELHALAAINERAFIGNRGPEWYAMEIGLYEPSRTHGAFDGDELVGGGTLLRRRMTLPGGRRHPVAAVSAIAVAPDQRRRGALSAIMRAELHGQHEEGGDSFAALYASEGTIYGRFGYGLASYKAELSIPRGAAFHSTVDNDSARIREMERESALPLMTDIYDRVAATQPGWIDRNKESWAARLYENIDGLRAKNTTRWRYAMHPDGYALYNAQEAWGDRKPEGVVQVREIVARTPHAYAALWRYVLSIDLTCTVEIETSADDPILHMLADVGDAYHSVGDGLWVRVIDVDRALPLRQYSAPLDVVLAIEDTFCPWNAGNWRLVVDAEGDAVVERTTADPDLAMGVSELGAVFLGGTTVQHLVASQRIRELTPGKAIATSRALRGDRLPHCPEVF